MKAKEILKLTIEKGFEDAGYKVISYSSDITANTVVIDAIVERFWYWLDYNGTDRFASSEITISFNAINKNTGKHNSFKISNKYSIDILNFMSPLKNTVENSLIEYSKLISKTIPEKIIAFDGVLYFGWSFANHLGSMPDSAIEKITR